MVITLSTDDAFSVFDTLCGETYNFPYHKGFHFYEDATFSIAPMHHFVAQYTTQPPPTAGIALALPPILS